ncbi:MAG: hypothetical protein AB6733_18210 [Clostridiaceae bacterium]
MTEETLIAFDVFDLFWGEVVELLDEGIDLAVVLVIARNVVTTCAAVFAPP